MAISRHQASFFEIESAWIDRQPVVESKHGKRSKFKDGQQLARACLAGIDWRMPMRTDQPALAA